MLKKALLLILSLTIISLFCYINAVYFNIKQIKNEENIIKTDKYSGEDIVIAFFSDLHYGSYVNEDYLNNVIENINKFDPDIVIFGGDLLDIDNKQIRTVLIHKLKEIKSKYGKYAVYGETDINSLDTINDIYKESNFKVLNNESLSIKTNDDLINIVGLNIEPNTQKAFEGITNNKYTICISHYPDYFDKIKEYNCDYMLSGHSHGPQIYIPLISSFNVEYGCQKYYHGTKRSEGKTLDISNGVGRTKFNARFLADAQINIYTIKKDTIVQDSQNNIPQE